MGGAGEAGRREKRGEDGEERERGRREAEGERMLPLQQPQRARAAERRPVLAPAGLRGRPAPPVPAPLRARPAPPPFAQRFGHRRSTGRGSAGPRLLPQPADRLARTARFGAPEPRPAKAKGSRPQGPRLLISH